MEERIQEVPPDLQIQLDELRVRVEALERAMASFRPRHFKEFDGAHLSQMAQAALNGDLGGHRFTEEDF